MTPTELAEFTARQRMAFEARFKASTDLTKSPFNSEEYLFQSTEDLWYGWFACAVGLHERMKLCAWMTEDGRVATDETKQTAMASSSREAFTIPLYQGDV